MINPTKRYRTRDGNEVRHLTLKQGPNSQFLEGWILFDNCIKPQWWTAEGTLGLVKQHPLDLVEMTDEEAAAATSFMIDINKKYRTRNGEEAREVCEEVGKAVAEALK